jgi:hypothetical protein
MGTIRKHEVRILVAICFVMFVVLAAAIVYGPPGPASSSIPRTQDAVAMEGVDAVITGQAERTSTGYAVPMSVTNHRDKAISMKDMRIIVTLTDIRSLNATCHGPDSVAPGETKQFLVLVDGIAGSEIFVIDLVQGNHYIRVVMPVVPPTLSLPDVPQVTVPDDDTSAPSQNGTQPSDPDDQDSGKDEPKVALSLNNDLPLRSAYYEGNPPFFGAPVSGQVIAHITNGDASDIGIYVYLPDLTIDQVKIGALSSGGTRIPVQLTSDGTSGCYGLLIDGSSPTGSNYTWHYDGIGSAYHNISLTVTTYELGTHEMRIYAYDAGTGARVSEVEVTDYTVYGSGGGDSSLRMFDTEMSSDIADPFVPGAIYNVTFTDNCRYDEYRGTVRSVFKCPYAMSVWSIGMDGSETLLTPNSYGEYVVTWEMDGPVHDLRLRVQLGEEGGSYPLASGQYWLEDSSTGMVLSPVSSEGATGTVFTVRGPEII